MNGNVETADVIAAKAAIAHTARAVIARHEAIVHTTRVQGRIGDCFVPRNDGRCTEGARPVSANDGSL
jgi:hypothetical protein